MPTLLIRSSLPLLAAGSVAASLLLLPALASAQAPAAAAAKPVTPAAKPVTPAAAPVAPADAGAPTKPTAEAKEAPPEGADAAPENDAPAAAEPPPEPVVEGPVAEKSAEPVASDEDAEDQKTWMALKSDDDDDDDDDKKMPYYTTFLLAEGTVKYGAITVANVGSSLNDEDPDTETLRAGQVGGQFTLGVMPGGRAFTMGGRLRGGSYLGERVTWGNVAGEMLFGANFARNAQGSSFTYFLGGVGVEFLPSESQDMLTLSASGGTVMNGVDFGAGLNIGLNDEYASVMFGMHIGWGRLY